MFEVLCDGQPPRLIVPREGPPGQQYSQVFLPIPAGSPQVRLRLRQGTGRWLVTVSERLARSPAPELPAPGADLPGGPPSLEPALAATALDVATEEAVRAGLAALPSETLGLAGPQQAAAIQAVAILTGASGRAVEHAQGAAPAILHLARSRLLASLGERALAQADLQRVLERRDAPPEIRAAAREDNTAALAVAGYRREALTERLALLAAGRDHAAQRLAIGDLLLSSGDSRAALAVFRPLVQVRPEDALAAARLVQTLVLLGLPDEALAHATPPPRANHSSDAAELAYARAVALVAAGRLDEAAPAFRAAAAGAPAPLARAALARAAEVETALAAPFAESSARDQELAYLAETWTDRARDRDWQPPDSLDVLAYETALRTVTAGIPLLSPTYRVSPGRPLELELTGPGRARLSIRPDCRPTAAGRSPRGSVAWTLQLDGLSVGEGRADDVPPSAEVSHPEAPGLLPGQAQTVFVDLPSGRHRLAVAGVASSFGVRVSVQASGYDDLLSPEGLLAQSVAGTGAVTEAQGPEGRISLLERCSRPRQGGSPPLDPAWNGAFSDSRPRSALRVTHLLRRDLSVTKHIVPGGPSETTPSHPLTAALRLHRSGRTAEARRLLEAAPASREPRRLLLLAQLRATLGDSAGSRAMLATLPAGLPPELAARAAAIRLDLAAAASPETAEAWSDLLAALAGAEELLREFPDLEEAREVRAAALDRLDWDELPGVDRAASAETLVTTGEASPAPPAVLLRRALAYSPWGPARTMAIGRNRLRLELAAEGGTAVALEVWPERQMRGLEPPPRPGTSARLVLRVDDRPEHEWLAPLHRISRLELPPLPTGNHVLELALDEPDGRTVAAVRVWLDRPIVADGGRLGLGQASSGGWHPLEPRRVHRTFAATAKEPVEVSLRGPAVVRVYGRHLAGPEAAPARSLAATVYGRRGLARTASLELSERGDPAAFLVDRTGFTAGAESLLQLVIPEAGEHRIVLAPPAGSSALVRLELPAPAAPPAAPTIGPLTADQVALAPGAPRGQARPLDGPHADLLADGTVRRGTLRYRLAYDENLRPENEDFRVDRKVIASVTSYRASWDGTESRAWQADSRLRVAGLPAHVLEHRYTRSTRRDTGPRWRAAASAATQPVGGAQELALRGSAQVDWLRQDGPRLRHVPAAGLDAYAGTLAGAGATPPGQIDPEVYTRFDRQHPAALFVQDTLTYSPHTDGEYFVRGRATTNASLRPYDLDRASLRLGTRQLRQPFEAEAAFTHTERFQDNHRDRRIQDDDLSLELSWSRWLNSGRYLVAALGAVYRDRFSEWLPGVAISLTAPRGRGFGDLPPGAMSFEGLKELEVP